MQNLFTPVNTKVWFRKSRSRYDDPKNKSGQMVVDITIGKRKFGPRPTGISCKRGDWDPKASVFIGPHTEELTAQLDEFKAALREAKAFVVFSNKTLIPENIWEAYLGKKEQGEFAARFKSMTVDELWGKIIEYCQLRVKAKQLKDSSITVYEKTFSMWRRFVRAKFKGKCPFADEVDAKIFRQYESWMLTQPRLIGDKSIPLHRNWISKCLSYLKSTLRYGVKEGFLEKFTLEYEQLTWKTPDEPRPLTLEEINQLLVLRVALRDLRRKRLYNCVSGFLFAAGIGTHHTDYFHLKDSDLKVDEEGHLYFFTDRKKTDIPYLAYLREFQVEMIKEYGSVEALPKMGYGEKKSGDTFNKLLKEIGRMAGINFPLTFGTARDTFSSRLAANGATDFELMRSMGWTSLQYYRHYIHTSRSKLKELQYK